MTNPTPEEVREVLDHVRGGGPHEWGYRDLTDGTFIEDDWPFRAADLLERLAQPTETASGDVVERDAWIDWRGGEMPVDGDTMVEVQFGGRDTQTGRARWFNGGIDHKFSGWRQNGPHEGWVIRYRLATLTPPDRDATAGQVPLAFISAILHGDEAHRAWLLEAADCWNTDRPVPPPTKATAGEGNALAEELERLNKRAYPAPWCWEQCGEKEDNPVLGVAWRSDDENCVGVAGQLRDIDDNGREVEYEREQLAYEWHSRSDGTASANVALVVALRNNLPAILTALRQQATDRQGVPSAVVHASGPVNGMGEPDPLGSYVLLGIAVGDDDQRLKFSFGGAGLLAAELNGVIGERSLRAAVKTTTGQLVTETDEQIALALRWYRRQSSRHGLMARIDELEAQATDRESIKGEDRVRDLEMLVQQLVVGIDEAGNDTLTVLKEAAERTLAARSIPTGGDNG